MQRLLILFTAFALSSGVFAQEHGMDGMEKKSKMAKMENKMDMKKRPCNDDGWQNADDEKR